MTTTTATTEQLTWSPSWPSGEWTVVNAYKITNSGVLPGYHVEPLRVDGLPFLESPLTAYADTLDEALRLADRPVCRGCGRAVAGWALQWPDTELGCPTRPTNWLDRRATA